MDSPKPPASGRGFCSNCGAKLDPAARFCHACGTPAGGASLGNVGRGGLSGILVWGIPAIAVIAVVVIVAVQYGARGAGPADAGSVSLMGGGMAAGRAPDISSMTPEERASRLFDRVMRLVSEGHTDSAAFFGPMAIGAFEALTPHTAHVRYDMGLVALVTGDVTMATAQADTILRERPNHLLGLALAARAADTRGDAAGASAFRRRLVAAEAAERAANLPEYTDHDNDIRAALEAARR